jgi:uncharacterized YccA/Bax inhibitor family protein
MRTANPTLNENVFRTAAENSYGEASMTIQGTVNKTFLLLLMVVASASFTWKIFLTSGIAAVYPWMIGGAIGGLVFALVTAFVPRWAWITAPIYGLLEGLILGGLSAILETVFEGIVIQAVGLTFGTLFVMLTIYKSGIIKVTDKFRIGIIAATGSICLIYLATWVLGMFGVAIPYIHGNGWIGIGFSLVVLVIAALNLVLDFDFIERGQELGAPKYMEWYGAFGLIVTLVWLYIEFLRLLSKMRSR